MVNDVYLYSTFLPNPKAQSTLQSQKKQAKQSYWVKLGQPKGNKEVNKYEP